MTTNESAPIDPQDPTRGMAVYQPLGQGGLQTRGTVDLSIEEISAIYTIKIENAIRAKMGAISAEIKTLRKEHREIAEMQDKILRTWCEDNHKGSADAAIAALCDFLETGKGSLEAIYRDNAAYDHNTNKITCHLCISSFTDSTRTFSGISINRRYVDDPTPEFVTNYYKAKELVDVVKEKETELAELRTALFNIPVQQRQAKAKIAEAVASETEEGRALLSKMQDEMDVESIIESLKSV